MHGAGRERVESDVAPGQQAAGHGVALGVLEVELQRKLRRVEGAEKLAAVDPGDVILEWPDQPQAVGWVVALDVDDGRAVVSERLGRDGADADPRKVGDLDSLERKAFRPVTGTLATGGPSAGSLRGQ